MSGLAVAHNISHIKKALGLTQDNLASYLGASSRSVRRWEKQDVEISSDTAERLDMLDKAIHLAAGLMEQDKIEAWFQTKNPSLDNLKPVQLINSYAGLIKIQRILTELEWGLF